MTETKLNWNNLKNFLCPKCSQSLYEAPSGDVRCSSDQRGKGECRFHMSKKRFDEVVGSVYSKTKI